MLTSAINSDLQLMAEYDFKEPIHATVLYYDSGDESEPSTAENKEHNKNIRTINKDKIISDILTDISKLSNKVNHEPIATKEKRKTTGDSKIARNSKILKVAENTDGSIDLVFQNNEKFSNTTADSTDQDNSTEEQRSNVSQIATITLQENLIPQNQDDLTKKTNECLQILLNTVSTHLIYVMKAITEYITIYKRTCDKSVVDEARNHLQNTRTKFFDLSFSTVANIMLPKENDSTFMNNFIDDTIKLAKARKFNIKRSNIKLLCTEMFGWAKSHIQHPILADLLENGAQCTEPVINTNSNNEQNGCDNTNCIFLSGPTCSELRVSTINQNCQNPMQQPSDIVQNVPTRQNTQTSRYDMRDNLHSTNFSNMQQFEQFNTRDYNLHREVQYKSRQPQANNVQMQIHSPILSQQKNPRLPSSNYNTPSCQPQTQETPENHYMDQLENSAHYDSYCQAEQAQLKEIDRSSMSRDSGFTSSLSSVSCDPMYGLPRYNRIDSSSMFVAPLITHVTSLNPSVAYIKDGQCYVCGKLTKHKCLGCYKYYYCSIKCQNSDWKYHVYICK